MALSTHRHRKSNCLNIINAIICTNCITFYSLSSGKINIYAVPKRALKLSTSKSTRVHSVNAVLANLYMLFASSAHKTYHIHLSHRTQHLSALRASRTIAFRANITKSLPHRSHESACACFCMSATTIQKQLTKLGLHLLHTHACLCLCIRSV